MHRTQFLPYYALAKPIRRRLTVALLAFRAIDREEDRPHTLEWLVSQAVAGLAAIVGIMIFLSYSISENKSEDKAVRMMLVMIPIIINGVGDGLAEPVGIRFGKHKYRTRALWYQGRCCSGSFTRSFEVRAGLSGVARALRRCVRRGARASSSQECWRLACSAFSILTLSSRWLWPPSRCASRWPRRSARTRGTRRS